MYLNIASTEERNICLQFIAYFYEGRLCTEQAWISDNLTKALKFTVFVIKDPEKRSTTDLYQNFLKICQSVTETVHNEIINAPKFSYSYSYSFCYV